LHMAPKWFDHWTTWAGRKIWLRNLTIANAVCTRSVVGDIKPIDYYLPRYGDGAGNTVEENSSVFSLIRMC